MKTCILTFAVVLISTLHTFGHPSWGIVVDSNRNIYFADISHHGRGAVYKLSDKGKFTVLLKDFHAHNVSLDKSENLITAHGEGQHIMIRYSGVDDIDTLFYSDDHNTFFGGNCSYSPEGEIIFGTDNYLWRINSYGEKEKLSLHKFVWNQSIYADDRGNYYGPDIGDGTGQLIMIDSCGRSSVMATNLITKGKRLYDPHGDILLGMTKSCDGHMYIAETAGRRIVKILDNQKTETFYSSDGQWFPTAIDFFAGDAYIMEYKESGKDRGPQVVKVDESGNAKVIFNYDAYQQQQFGLPTDLVPFKFLWIFVTVAISILSIKNIKLQQQKKAIRNEQSRISTSNLTSWQ